LTEGQVSSFGGSSDRVVLEAYNGYWDRRYPKLKSIIFENDLIGDRKKAMNLCTETEGNVDIVSHIRPLDTLKVAKSQFAKVVKSKDLTWLRGIYNLRKEGSKLKDIRLRKALNYAVNRKELLEFAARGNAHNLGRIIPPGTFGYNPDITPYRYNTAKAKALLEEAGYSRGFELRMIALERLRLETQIISRMLERVGIKAYYDILPEPEFWRKVVISMLDKSPEQQEWDIHFFSVPAYLGHPASMLPWNFIEETGIRWIEYDRTYEKMWRDLKTAKKPLVQEKAIQRMVKYLNEQAYALFIYSPISLYAVNKEVNFIPHWSAYLNLRETSVTENHWSVRGKNN
jgi:peptide/nickel transport system substrate-binding protein